MLWAHDPSTPIGVWDSVTEDATGLKVSGRLVLDASAGRDACVLLKAGAVDGLSIGFRTVKAATIPQGGRRRNRRPHRNQHGGPARPRRAPRDLRSIRTRSGRACRAHPPVTVTRCPTSGGSEGHIEPTPGKPARSPSRWRRMVAAGRPCPRPADKMDSCGCETHLNAAGIRGRFRRQSGAAFRLLTLR